MPNETVFEEPQIQSERPLGWAEPAVHWFSEITRHEAVVSRKNVNEWYSRFPDQNGRLKDRLTSEVDIHHLGALDELYVFQLLKASHAEIKYEEGGKGPDFRISSDQGPVGAVEVLSLFQQEKWDRESRRFAVLADEINKRVKLDRYFVRIDVQKAKAIPAPSRLAAFIHRHIDALPPPEVVAPTIDRTRHLPGAIFQEDGVRVLVEFMPRRSGLPSSPDDRVVGMGPISGGMVNSGERLRKVLDKKAGGRYQISGVPFVIAVVNRDQFCSIDQVEAALYGNEQVYFPEGKLSRANNGFFGATSGEEGARNTRVSAVLMIAGFNPWLPDSAKVLLLENPYARNPLSSDFVRFTHRFCTVSAMGDKEYFGWHPEKPIA